jgi:hypothetical protein
MGTSSAKTQDVEMRACRLTTNYASFSSADYAPNLSHTAKDHTATIRSRKTDAIAVTDQKNISEISRPRFILDGLRCAASEKKTLNVQPPWHFDEQIQQARAAPS